MNVVDISDFYAYLGRIDDEPSSLIRLT